MYPSDTSEADEQQGRWHTWRTIRWLITVAASLMLFTLFLTQGTSTEAAAPAATAPAATDTAVYHEMDAACPQGFNCIANNCLSGNYNFCYNMNYAYPYNFGAAYGCGIGGLNCGIGGGGVNFVYPSFVNYNGFYNGVNRFPVFINPNNACNVGNFSCFNANGCNVGNFSCANANFPFFGNPFFFNGGAVSTATTTAVGVNRVTVTSNTGQVVIYNPREIAQPAAPTVQVAPVAAPVAPAANYATPLNAPAQAPAAAVTSGGDIHVLSAAPATKPAVTTDADDHRG